MRAQTTITLLLVGAIFLFNSCQKTSNKKTSKLSVDSTFNQQPHEIQMSIVAMAQKVDFDTLEVATEGVYPDVIEHPIPDDLSQFQQPESLIADMKAITTGSLEQRLEALKAKAQHDFVFVKGGAFLMGDFGSRQNKKSLPWTAESDDNPLHKVYLDSYSISKYKVTQAELNLYAQAHGLPTNTGPLRSKTESLKKLSVYAIADWNTAQAYCQWLGDLLGLSGSLPTEAQWEYAARNRGRFILFATSNGKLELNRNVPTTDLATQLSLAWYGEKYAYPGLPVGLFPPTPLGLYDMTMLAKEWVYDWYSPNYYEISKNAINPTGPKSGDKKTIRSSPIGRTLAAETIRRFSHAKTSVGDERWWVGRKSFRCVIKNPTPVK